MQVDKTFNQEGPQLVTVQVSVLSLALSRRLSSSNLPSTIGLYWTWRVQTRLFYWNHPNTTPIELPKTLIPIYHLHSSTHPMKFPRCSYHPLPFARWPLIWYPVRSFRTRMEPCCSRCAERCTKLLRTKQSWKKRRHGPWWQRNKWGQQKWQKYGEKGRSKMGWSEKLRFPNRVNSECYIISV